MEIRRAVVPLLVASVLTACGGEGSGDADTEPSPGAGDSTSATPSGSSGADSEVAACDLLTPAEVEAAVGAAVEEGVASAGDAATGGTFSTCIWTSADPENPLDKAQLYLYSETSAADSARAEDSEEVAGIGDAAFTVSYAGLWVYQGERSFMTQWYTLSGTDEENLPGSEALARAVSAKLG